MGDLFEKFEIPKPSIKKHLPTFSFKNLFMFYLAMTVLTYGLAYSDLDEFELRSYFQDGNSSAPVMHDRRHVSRVTRGTEAIIKAWIWPYYLSSKLLDKKNSNPCRDFIPVVAVKTK